MTNIPQHWMEIGSKVQALDELGRWEEGKIVGYEDTAPIVHFPGWSSDHDVVCKDPDTIRPLWDPFHCDFANIAGNRRALPKVTQWQAGQLHLLTSGDRVLILLENEEVEATVEIIDRFRHSMLVDFDGTRKEVHISSLCRKREETLPTRKRRGSSSAKHMRRELPIPAENVSSKRGGVDPLPVEIEIPVPAEVELMVQPHARLYNAGGTLIKCGGTYAVSGTTLRVAVYQLWSNNPSTADCWVIANDIDKDLKMQVPVDRLMVDAIPALSRQQTKKLACVEDQAIADEINNLRQGNLAFRKMTRRTQLIFALQKEVSSGLACKSLRRTFVLGPSTLDFDTDLLDLTIGVRKKFNYRDGTICNLDDLLGKSWDVRNTNGTIRFITQMVLYLNRNLMLTGSLWTAICRDQAALTSQDYRDILSASISLVSQEDEEEEFDNDMDIEEYQNEENGQDCSQQQ